MTEKMTIRPKIQKKIEDQKNDQYFFVLSIWSNLHIFLFRVITDKD